jgi:hypothetical protein
MHNVRFEISSLLVAALQGQCRRLWARCNVGRFLNNLDSTLLSFSVVVEALDKANAAAILGGGDTFRLIGHQWQSSARFCGSSGELRYLNAVSSIQ